MLTFEEFFAKKKIDLEKLKTAEPELFSQFAHQYPLMGERSFDHSKKFLFNKLRRQYHTPDLPKAEIPKSESDITDGKIASQAENLESPTISQKVGFTPRFKAKPAALTNTAPKVADESTAEKPVAPKPAGFKPKFVPKTGVKKEEVKSDALDTNENVSNDGAAEATKPAFKPKFSLKTPVKKASETEEKNIPEDQIKTSGDIPTQPKTTQPFKPRFNAKNIKPKGE